MKQSIAMDTPESREQATFMLEAFHSIGVSTFDVMFTNVRRKGEWAAAELSLAQLRSMLADLLRRSEEQHWNLIIRPHQPAQVKLVLLDNIDIHAVVRVHELALLTLQTAPGTYQCWTAIRNGDTEIARRLRKGLGAAITAAGACRIAGTVNYQERFRPLFPIVALVSAHPGQLSTPEQMAGLLSE
jgi:hypothetical protein